MRMSVTACLAAQACRGQGVRLHMRPLGPGMMQQIQVPCDTCSQTGYQVPKNDACPNCSTKVSTPAEGLHWQAQNECGIATPYHPVLVL